MPALCRAALHDALAVAAAQPSTLAFALIHLDRPPGTMVVIDGCPCTREAVVFTVEQLLPALDADALALATNGVMLGWDVELELWRWLAARCDQAGVPLLDWLVIEPGGACSIPALWDELPPWFSGSPG